MKTFLVHIFSICSVMFIFSTSSAQNITLNAKLDTNQILIGDQINLVLDILCPKNTNISFPNITDTLSEKVEIVSQSKIDTIFTNDKEMISYKRKILITSFDSGQYVIPSLFFVVKNQEKLDTISSLPQILNVYTLPVDTTKNEIMDIKQPYGAPLTFREVIPYILYSILAILIVWLVFYIVKHRKKRIPLLKILEKPKEPAHIIALRELDKLKNEKLWQNNKVKEYHSEISEIIRRYIENRFQIMALEQTTEEIISAIKITSNLEEPKIEILNKTLRLADLVKFAKVEPLPDENETSLRNSYQFVNETKLEMKENEDKKNEQISTEPDVK